MRWTFFDWLSCLYRTTDASGKVRIRLCYAAIRLYRMIRTHQIVSALALFGSLSSAAQTESEPAPAPHNARMAQSPRVFPDGPAHFTLKAPEAKSVQLAGAVSSSP